MNWLDELKPGDEVACGGGLYGMHIRQVEKITKLHVILCGNGGRYRRKNGSSVGSDPWSRDYIQKPTPELRRKIRIDVLSTRLRRTNWDNLPLESLEKINAIIKSQKPAEEKA